jgi:heptosyltransferase-2
MNVMIVRLGGIGDAVLSLAVAAAVKKARPESAITMLSGGRATPVFDHHPDVQRAKAATGSEPLRELIELFRDAVDAAVFLMPYRRLMWASFLARVPLRVATGYRWHSLLANRRVYQHRKHFTKHEAEYNLDLLRGLGIDPGPLMPPALVVTESERREAEERMSPLPAPRIVIHPGGVTSRRWSSRRYWELAKRMAGRGIGVVLTGSAEERAVLHAEVPEARQEKSGILNVMGRLTLRQLMGLVSGVRALVSGSTGPAHIAAALGVPTVSLFDPRRLSAPIRWRPLGTGVLLQPAVPECPKCVFESCPYWDCLDRITVDEVDERLSEVIRTPAPLRVMRV